MTKLTTKLLGSAAFAVVACAATGALALDQVDAPASAPTAQQDGLQFSGGWTEPVYSGVRSDNNSTLLDRSPTTSTVSYVGRVAVGENLNAGVRFDIESETDEGNGNREYRSGQTTFFAGGSFGDVAYGNASTATDTLHIQGASALAGYDAFRIGEERNSFWTPMLGFGRVSRRGPNVVDDEATVRFMMPAIGGFSVGVSYTNSTDTLRVSDGLNMRFEDMVSVAAQYVTQFGATTTTVYGGYEKSNLLSQPHDIASFGVKLERGGVTLAGGFGYEDVESGAVGFRGFMHGYSTAWGDVGASYAQDNWALSVGAAWEKRKPGAFTSSLTDLQDFGVSTSFFYRVVPGFSVLGSLAHYRLENAEDSDGFSDSAFLYATPDDAATTFSLATRVQF